MKAVSTSVRHEYLVGPTASTRPSAAGLAQHSPVRPRQQTNCPSANDHDEPCRYALTGELRGDGVAGAEEAVAVPVGHLVAAGAPVLTTTSRSSSAAYLARARRASSALAAR
jgi:hypothetical protein